jgi:protoporphyrinogen oxidase
VSGQNLILGAGPAGLTAAYELFKLGRRSVVLEADDQVGGLSRTVNHKGFRFDIGGHRFFSKISIIKALWKEILGDDFLLRPRLSRIHYQDRFFDYPLKPVNALKGLGPAEASRILLSFVKAKCSLPRKETNFEEWVSSRFGRRLYEIFFKTYTEKVWGMPCMEISADWAAQRIKNLTLPSALLNIALGKGRNSNDRVATSLIDSFHYPRLGPGMMWERCSKLLSHQGTPTLCGMTIEEIRHRQGRVESVIARDRAGIQEEFGGSDFISTLPLKMLLRSLNPSPPDAVLKAAGALNYRDYLTVVLIVKRENVFTDNWIYIHSPKVRVARIQNYKNWSPDMVPDLSRTSLGFEYYLSASDAMWEWPQDRLIDLAVRESVQLGFIFPDEIEDGTVVRMKGAYPIYDSAYKNHLETIRNYLSSFSNLQTIGRSGLHRYNNQDHSMLTGIYAAHNVLGENCDVWHVNAEMDYHEESVGHQSGDGVLPAPWIGGRSQE